VKKGFELVKLLKTKSAVRTITLIDDSTVLVGENEGWFEIIRLSYNLEMVDVITSQQFAAWMRILSRVGHSVLWLLADSDNIIVNLRARARSYGVDPQRLIFASRIEPDLHLKRHELADLFLDTLPYNAHTTASDALWAGLPVLTCLGSTFPGRVAASLLKQLQLEELITENLQAYEDLAVELALNPRRLSEIKQKLAVQRNQSDLFDGRAYARKLESLFVQMYEKSCSGKPPEVIFSTSS